MFLTNLVVHKRIKSKKKKKKFADNQFHNILRIFLSPQVKRWAIITSKHGIYKLPQELPNDLRDRT